MMLADAIAELPPIALPTRHFFADGMYCRFLAQPAGAVVMGNVHKREHFFIVASGTVRVTEDLGESAAEYTAPTLLVSRPGTQRAVLAVTDAVCLTVHRLERRTSNPDPVLDIAEIERELAGDP
jgi:hypothetical protein